MKKSMCRWVKISPAPLAVFMLIVFSLIAGAASAETVQAVDVTSNCPQKRKTPKAPEKETSRVNPLPRNIESIKSGEGYFKKATPIPCQTCHGVRGDGQGDPDFESTPPARNFTCWETMKAIPDGQLFWVIRNGSPNTAMPAFGGLSDEAIWQVIHYIRFLANESK